MMSFAPHDGGNVHRGVLGRRIFASPLTRGECARRAKELGGPLQPRSERAKALGLRAIVPASRRGATLIVQHPVGNNGARSEAEQGVPLFSRLTWHVCARIDLRFRDAGGGTAVIANARRCPSFGVLRDETIVCVVVPWYPLAVATVLGGLDISTAIGLALIAPFFAGMLSWALTSGKFQELVAQDGVGRAIEDLFEAFEVPTVEHSSLIGPRLDRRTALARMRRGADTTGNV
jgi:hypothetical protein